MHTRPMRIASTNLYLKFYFTYITFLCKVLLINTWRRAGATVASAASNTSNSEVIDSNKPCRNRKQEKLNFTTECFFAHTPPTDKRPNFNYIDGIIKMEKGRINGWYNN